MSWLNVMAQFFNRVRKAVDRVWGGRISLLIIQLHQRLVQ